MIAVRWLALTGRVPWWLLGFLDDAYRLVCCAPSVQFINFGGYHPDDWPKGGAVRIVVVATAVAVTLATQPGGCTATPKSCDLSFAGITVKAGRVWETVTAVCDVRPLRHVLQVWMEYKPFDTWDAYDRTATTWDIPGSGTDPDDLGDQPVQLTVSSPCLEGTYRTRAYTKGTGPATAEAPAGIPFEFEDTGWRKFVSAADCAGE